MTEAFSQAGSLELDLEGIVEWGERWLVTFNAGKTKLLSVSRCHKVPLLPIAMHGQDLSENDSFRLLGLTFSNTLTWNEYVEAIAKSAAQKVGSLYRARAYLTPESILYLYKASIRPCMEYCCHLWAGAPAHLLNLLDKIQKRVSNMVGPQLSLKLQPLSHRRDVADKIKACLINLGQDITEKDMETLVSRHDQDKDGSLNFQEFLELLGEIEN